MPQSTKYVAIPAQVYLDSADFSALSDVRRDAARRNQTLSRLREAVRRRVIEIRFSAIHVIEASPLDLVLTDPGVRRLRLIGELCGKKALRYFTDLCEEEFHARIEGRMLTGIPRRALADDGHWMPGIDSMMSDLEQQRRDTIELVRTMPREQRRRFLSRDGRGVTLLDGRGAALEMARQIAAKWPGFERCAPALQRFMRGDAEASDVEREFLVPFISLSDFAQVYLDNFDAVQAFIKWLRELGTENATRLSRLRKDLDAVSPALPSDMRKSIADNQYESTRQNLALCRTPGTAARMLGKEAEFAPFASYSEAAALAPTFYSMSEAFLAILGRSMVPEKTPRKPTPSDIGDTLHAAYIPHVDYFRCDAAMADCFSHIGKRFGTVLVSSLDELVAQLKI